MFSIKCAQFPCLADSPLILFSPRNSTKGSLTCELHLIFFVQKLRFFLLERQDGNQYLILLHLKPVEKHKREEHISNTENKKYIEDHVMKRFSF